MSPFAFVQFCLYGQPSQLSHDSYFNKKMAGGYAFYDIDSNGENELIITYDYDPENYVYSKIDKIYYLKNEKPELLIEDDYCRNTLYITTDNEIVRGLSFTVTSSCTEKYRSLDR